MQKAPKTQRIDIANGRKHFVYYGIVTLSSGHNYYIGPYKSRSTARRRAIKAMNHWSHKS